MRSLIVCMGMLALLLVSGGCGGTVRQLTDDGKSDAPELIILTPNHGVSGESVQFEVLINDLEGSLGVDFQVHPEVLQSLQFIWNFGGGAEPNVVITNTPKIPSAVQLRDGIRSPYTGTLTVLGGKNAEDRLVYNFTYTVEPLSVVTVGPFNGVEATNATFSAVIGSGVVTDWIWDFGGACNPNGSNESNPSVRFNNLPDGVASQDFQARLIVSNNFEVTTFPFTITVLAGN